MKNGIQNGIFGWVIKLSVSEELWQRLIDNSFCNLSNCFFENRLPPIFIIGRFSNVIEITLTHTKLHLRNSTETMTLIKDLLRLDFHISKYSELFIIWLPIIWTSPLFELVFWNRKNFLINSHKWLSLIRTNIIRISP